MKKIICIYCNKKIYGEYLDIHCNDCNVYYRIDGQATVLSWSLVYSDYDLYFRLKNLKLYIFHTNESTPFLIISGDSAKSIVLQSKESVFKKIKALDMFS